MRWLILTTIVLAGCTSYEERVAASCARLGFPMGTGGYPACVQMQIAKDQRDRAMWGGIAAAGAALMQPTPKTVYVGY